MIRFYVSRLLGERKWTQKELADKTGIRPATINLYYYEIIERVNVEHLDKMCEAFGCDLSELIEYIPNTK